MRRSITGIDHAVVVVPDLERARSRYRRLGFTVAPRGAHPPELGTANHTVMLEREYVELLGVVAPAPANEPWRRALEQGEGLAALALQTSSADAVVAEMAADGVALDPPVDFARPVALHGLRSQAAFRTAHFPRGIAPGFHVFCCEHRTRHITWRPELLHHANGAVALDEVIVASDAPAADAARVGAIFAREPRGVAGGGILVDTGNGTIRFATAEALAGHFAGADLSDLRRAGPAGLVLRTRSAADALAALAAGSVRHAITMHGIVVAPRDACGVVLVLREG